MQEKYLKSLYGISDRNLTPNKYLFAQLEHAIEGGMKIFQYRDKESKDSEISTLVQELQDFCTKKDVLFILNDRFELALKLNLSGLHLGREELANFSAIRKEFEGVIGISCYNNLSMAQEFENMGADYVAFGAFFQSKIKPNTTKCEPILLKQAKQNLKIPICAIGGINATNTHLLQESDMIAIISSLWTSQGKNINEYADKERFLQEITKNAKEILQIFHNSVA